MKTETAIYPGSFDPITLGHLDIIHRAAKIFDKLIVVVMVNPAKKCAFSPEERVELIKKCTSDLDNITVEFSDGLLADYAKEKKAGAIIKGLRALSDFEYEFQMALLNKALNPEYETVFMMTDSKYSYISSSMVKELAKYNGRLDGFVPARITEKIMKKF